MDKLILLSLVFIISFSMVVCSKDKAKINEIQIEKIEYRLSSFMAHTMLIKEDGTLWIWGWNKDGRLITDAEESIIQPTKIMDNILGS